VASKSTDTQKVETVNADSDNTSKLESSVSTTSALSKSPILAGRPESSSQTTTQESAPTLASLYFPQTSIENSNTSTTLIAINKDPSDSFQGKLPDFDPPLAAVNRLIKAHAPESISFTKEARAAYARAAGLFIYYITHCANDICRENKRQTIYASDIETALR
jgi:histone H3/H4